MLKCLYVGLGGFIGAICRYLLGLALISVSMVFPFNTLLINVLGSLAIGIISELARSWGQISANLLLFLTVGICGGFTTFSTFSIESVDLLEKGKALLGIGYIVFSIILCLAGVLLGKTIVRAFAS